VRKKTILLDIKTKSFNEMTRNIIVAAFFILLTTNCSKDDYPPLLIGEWKLIEVYGPYGWSSVTGPPVHIISFNSKGDYTIYNNDEVTCRGSFKYEKENTLYLKLNDCLPLISSTETIYTLTTDTLIISNNSITYSSFSDQKDKYIRNK